MSCPFQETFSAISYCNENKWIGCFHRDRKPGLQPKITELNSSNRGCVGVGFKRPGMKKKRNDYLLLTVSKNNTESELIEGGF